MGVASLTDTINLWVAASLRPRRTREIWKVFRDALGPSPDATDLTVYLRALSGAWGLLFWASVCLMIGLAFAANALFGNTGNAAGIAVGVFPMGFCLVGEFDAAWRYKVARRASRLAGIDDEHVARLVRKARANDGGIVLQLLGGMISSLIAVLALA